MNKCYFCGKELDLEKIMEKRHKKTGKYCDRNCMAKAKHYTNAGCTTICLECGIDCESIQGLLSHVESQHQMNYTQYAAKHIYETTSVCEYCGAPLDFDHVRRGFRYCNRKCFSKSDLQSSVGLASFSLNKYNPYWNYRNYVRWFDSVPQKIYLYVISTETYVKVGICFDVYKRLSELYRRSRSENNFNINLLLYSDTILITSIEAYLKRVYTEVNEYYNISDLDGILDILQNLEPWFRLNNFSRDFNMIKGTFEVEYISNIKDVVTLMNDYCVNTGINISDPTLSSYWENINEPFQGIIYNKQSCIKTVSVVDSSEETTHLFELTDGLVTHNCCRLRLDKRELMKRGGGLFGAAERTGSTGVVTINLPQLGYLYKGDKDGFYKELDRLLVLAKESLVIKRQTIEHLMNGGFYPYGQIYVQSYDTFFNTIGINGGDECVRNFTDDAHNIADTWGQKFINELLDYINTRLADFQEETGLLFNLEAAPSEGTGYRLALHDKQTYPDIIVGGDGTGDPYYTNSTWLPATYTDDIFEALDLQDNFQTKYTGGTVFHAYLGERIHNWKACAELIKTIFTNYRLPYLTISPTYSICPKHGYLDGEQKFCPKCRDEALTRVETEIRGVKEAIQKLETEEQENA